jgi:hypothetical protein
VLGATNYSIALTATAQAGAPTLVAIGQTPQLSEFVGPNGERALYNTTYSATITVNYVMTLGNGSTEVISIPKSAGLIVVGAHVDLDLASLWACPNLVSLGGTIKATSWMCDAIKYQWKFERMLNGQLYLVNGNPVVIEGYGVLGTRDYVVTAANGFGSGTEWRVQVRPIFANGIIGQYYTNYQCLKLKGTAAAAPMVEFSEEQKSSLNEDLVSEGLLVYPNPSHENQIHLRWSFEGSAEVKLIDSSGRLIYSSYWNNNNELNEWIIDATHLGVGLYWVEVKVGNDLVRRRWIRL